MVRFWSMIRGRMHWDGGMMRSRGMVDERSRGVVDERSRGMVDERSMGQEGSGMHWGGVMKERSGINGGWSRMVKVEIMRGHGVMRQMMGSMVGQSHASHGH